MAADVEIHDAPPATLRSQSSDVKLSRYRSVRKAQLKATEDVVPPLPLPPPIPESPEVQGGMKRSLSRYHRSKPTARPKAESTPKETESRLKIASSPRSPREEHYKHHAKASHPYSEYPSDALQIKPRGLMAMKTKDEDDEDTPLGTLMEQQARRKEVRVNHNTEGGNVLAGERARHEKIKAQQRAERAARDKQLEAERRKREEAEEAIRRLEREKAAEEERERLAREEEKERAVQEKLQAKQRAKEEKEQERAARKRRPTETSRPPQNDSEGRHSSSRGSHDSPESSRRIGGFFRRKKEDETPRPSTHGDDRRPKTSHASPPKWTLPTIRPGGGGIVPLNDAPVSGVVGVERKVKVWVKDKSLEIAVDVNTSAQQLIKSASKIGFDTFNPRAAIIYEYYAVQNIRRPLRMYENMRTVMNSWEDDKQNFLGIEESGLDSDQELFESNVPQQHQLKQFECWLEFEYKHDRYAKRWVTLRTDGQITVAKNESGKDQSNVCNLSDFDAYRVAPEAQKKKQKIFYVSIKSQQKSAMFLDMSDFIHDFRTDNKRLAEDFFRACQDWRSSYLVNKVGQGHQQATEGAIAGHTRSKSAESQYLLGTFNDLGLDFSSFAKPPEPQAPPPKQSFEENRPLGAFGLTLPSAQEHSKMMHSRQLSVRKDRSRCPPGSMRPTPSRPGGRDDALQALTGNAPVRQSWDSNRSGEGVFNPGGLLGSDYEQRRHNAKPSQDHSKGSGLHRNASVRSSRSVRRNSFDSATLGRSDSTRRQPHDLNFGPPLLDFTPQYKEPPQFAKRGKGFKPDHPSAGGLIENATSYENTLGLPGTEDWKARPNTSGATGLDRSRSINRTRSTRRPHPGTVPEESEAFTGTGLIANAKSGWGDNSMGHGVMSGNQARGPMLKMEGQSMFGNGTLLRKMEAQNLGNPRDREPWRVD